MANIWDPDKIPMELIPSMAGIVQLFFLGTKSSSIGIPALRNSGSSTPTTEEVSYISSSDQMNKNTYVEFCWDTTPHCNITTVLLLPKRCQIHWRFGGCWLSCRCAAWNLRGHLIGGGYLSVGGGGAFLCFGTCGILTLLCLAFRFGRLSLGLSLTCLCAAFLGLGFSVVTISAGIIALIITLWSLFGSSSDLQMTIWFNIL